MTIPDISWLSLACRLSIAALCAATSDKRIADLRLYRNAYSYPEDHFTVNCLRYAS